MPSRSSRPGLPGTHGGWRRGSRRRRRGAGAPCPTPTPWVGPATAYGALGDRGAPLPSVRGSLEHAVFQATSVLLSTLVSTLPLRLAGSPVLFVVRRRPAASAAARLERGSSANATRARRRPPLAWSVITSPPSPALKASFTPASPCLHTYRPAIHTSPSHSPPGSPWPSWAACPHHFRARRPNRPLIHPQPLPSGLRTVHPTIVPVQLKQAAWGSAARRLPSPSQR